MKILVAEKLSEHRYKTPEGYLICVDSILARTGKQTYKRSEIFGDDDERLVEVDRKAEEVFSPETMASFENKPICVEHPDVDVNSGNISEFAVGFVRDIHKGEYEGEPVMLGTLVITDAKTVEEIEEGKHTDLSCGYDCDIEDTENPQQRRIRGNHVALCEQGRAGIARIVDSVDEESTYTEVTKNLEKEANKNMSWLDSIIKDAEQTFRVLATVPGDYDDEPGFDIIFNVKANSENGAIEKAKKYAEKTPAYKFAWAFRIAKSNQRTRIERNVDSVKDAKTEYVFNYHDTYHGTRDKMRVDANNLDEAIREFGKTMALGGFGTANIYVVSVSPNDGYMRAYGKLSEMLKQKWTGDSVKDSTYKVEYISSGAEIYPIVEVDAASEFEAVETVRKTDKKYIRLISVKKKDSAKTLDSKKLLSIIRAVKSIKSNDAKETKLTFTPTNDVINIDMTNTLIGMLVSSGIDYHSAKKSAGKYSIVIIGDNNAVHKAKLIIENSGFFSKWS